MSKFKTVIPVDIDQVRKLLPKDGNIEALRFNPVTGEVEVFWETALLVTPFTFPVDFPIAQLAKRELPEKTSHRQAAKTKEQTPDEPPKGGTPNPAKKPVVSRQNARKASTARAR